MTHPLPAAFLNGLPRPFLLPGVGRGSPSALLSAHGLGWARVSGRGCMWVRVCGHARACVSPCEWAAVCVCVWCAPKPLFQNRLFQRDHRDALLVEPHVSYARYMTPPSARENQNNPAASFCTRLCQDQLNKRLRCAVNCVSVCVCVRVCFRRAPLLMLPAALRHTLAGAVHNPGCMLMCVWM